MRSVNISKIGNIIPHAPEGVFHCWGAEFEEFESGPGNYTVAVVEHSDGTVKLYPPEAIRFVDKPENDSVRIEQCRDVSIEM
ncbi:hypothetical protein [Oleidesulfovibrio sp.]|uniref:hypothetical protein n=1 Tax=Oleidesulfovibrio sp. TaxID=2909707 RepID=UPI003A8B8189